MTSLKSLMAKGSMHTLDMNAMKNLKGGKKSKGGDDKGGSSGNGGGGGWGPND